MPAQNEHGVEMPFGEPSADLGCVAAAKPVKARPLCEIAQEGMLVTRKKIDVPLEANAEACACLVKRASRDGHRRQ